MAEIDFAYIFPIGCSKFEEHEINLTYFQYQNLLRFGKPH